MNAALNTIAGAALPPSTEGTETMTEQWFCFKAYNSQSLYGYGTAAEAEQYAYKLNAGREINVYQPVAVSDAEADEMDLDHRGDAFLLDDGIDEGWET